MMFRCYLLFKVYARFTKFKSSLADRCCAKIGTEASTLFALKSSFKENPFLMLGYALTISVVAIGVVLR